MASKYVEAICRVTPHSCVCVPHAGNGAPGAECFPRIGLKVRWLCRFQDLCAKLREEKSQAKPTLPNDLHDHYDHIRPLQLSHPICAAATHGASVKLLNERLKCPIPPRDGRDRGRSSSLSCSVLQFTNSQQFPSVAPLRQRLAPS